MLPRAPQPNLPVTCKYCNEAIELRPNPDSVEARYESKWQLHWEPCREAIFNMLSRITPKK